ncbi:hypothetical protein CEE45_17270 [Candidatus Heimdallarchaeota archaeon B3_Heim]|nr:MAG: hypothetical protein CEE45_17270 [Candidatus Heimdallarchaeota archaeon B3_Heim]
MASTIKLVAGILIVLIGFPIFLGGSAVLLVTPIFADDQGYFVSESYQITDDNVTAVRLDIPLDDVQLGIRIDPSDFVTLKVNAFGETNEEIFLGLTTYEQAEIFLENVSYLEITNLDFSTAFPFDSEENGPAISMVPVISSNPTRIPSSTDVNWLLGGEELGNEFVWSPSYSDLTGGTLTLIMMNSDMGLGNKVNITFSIGARIPIINAIGWVLTVFGGLFLLLGIIIIWSGLRSKPRRVERTRYYQGAMATRVEPIERTAANYQLQCSNCGSTSDADSTFCSQCGEILLSEDRKAIDTAVKSSELGYLEPTGTKLVVADWGPRFWAYIIDFFIVSAITSTFTSILFFTMSDWTWWSFGVFSPFQWLFSLGPSSVVFFIYILLMDHYYGQTLGKMALNLEVISESTGERPLLQDLAIHNLGKAFFLPIDLIVGRIVRDQSQVPDMNQRLTQKWSRVAVVQKSRKRETTTQFVSNRLY